MMLLLKPKAPDEVIFYEFDWASRRLVEGEVIVDSGWEVAGGSVTIAANPPPSEEDGICRVYVEGGELGDVAVLTNWVETNLNPRREFSGRLKVKVK
jgi:hypothetical protein